MPTQSTPKTNGRYTHEDTAYWLSHIQRFAATKQTRKAYCRANNVDYDRFQYWYNKLKARQGVDAVKAIPVQLKSSTAQQVALCTVECANGNLLHVHDTQALQTILVWLS